MSTCILICLLYVIMRSSLLEFLFRSQYRRISININNNSNRFLFFFIRTITCTYVYGVILYSDYQFLTFEPHTRKPEQNTPKPAFIFINRLWVHKLSIFGERRYLLRFVCDAMTAAQCAWLRGLGQIKHTAAGGKGTIHYIS